MKDEIKIHPDDDCVIGTPEETRNNIVGRANKDAEESVQLGRDLKAGKRTVLFYSPSAFDWEPLHRFTHLCDTFVFVDPRATSAGLAAAMQPLVGGQTIVGGALVTDQQPNLLPPGAKYTAETHVVGEWLATIRIFQ